MRIRKKIWMTFLLGIGFCTANSQSDAMKAFVNTWQKNLQIAEEIYADYPNPMYDFDEDAQHHVYAIFVDDQFHPISEDSKWMLEQMENLPQTSKSFLINQVKRIDKDIRMSTKWIGLPFNASNLALSTTAFNAYYTDNSYSYGNFALPYYAAISEGLRIDSIYDERMNNVMAAYATGRYISRLQKSFDKWTYALYAYTHSPGEMQNLIRNGKADELENVAFHALIASLLFTKKHQDHLVPQTSDLPDFEMVQIKQKVHIGQIAEALDLPIQRLIELNPEIIGEIVYGDLKTTSYRLPLKYASVYKSYADYIPQIKQEKFFPKPAETSQQSREDILDLEYDLIYYKIRSGDNLGMIANRYKVRISDLKEWNNIRGEKIYADSYLKIYKKKASASTASNVSENSTKSTSSRRLIDTYIVKDGDTLASIARKYSGVSYQEIMSWNGIKDPGKLQVGQKIKIYSK